MQDGNLRLPVFRRGCDGAYRQTIGYPYSLSACAEKTGGAGASVRSVELAAELDVSKPSVYAMLRTLGEMGLVRKQPYSLAYRMAYGLPDSTRNTTMTFLQR